MKTKKVPPRDPEAGLGAEATVRPLEPRSPEIEEIPPKSIVKRAVEAIGDKLEDRKLQRDLGRRARKLRKRREREASPEFQREERLNMGGLPSGFSPEDLKKPPRKEKPGSKQE